MLMLVTRPDPDGAATAERLAALDIAAVSAPMMVRETLSTHLPDASGFAALAITSTNALRALAERDRLAPLLDKPLFAVGDRTAHEARMLGFADVTPAEGTLDSLVTTIALARPDGAVFYPCGRHLSGDLPHALAAHGLMAIACPVYDMVAQTRLPADIESLLVSGDLGAVLLYSRRTAEIFCDLATRVLPVEARRRLPVICLSDNVAEPVLANHFSRILLADHPSEQAMLALALTFTREQTGS